MNTFSVNPIVDEEIELLKKLAETIWPSTYQNIITQRQMLYMIDRSYNPAVLKVQLAQGGKIWVAKHKDQIIGYAHIQPESSVKAKVDKLYVLPEYQNQGVGKQLMEIIDHYATVNLIQRVILRVNKLNSKAIKAYLKYGFRITESVIQDIGSGFVMDDYIMEKQHSIRP